MHRTGYRLARLAPLGLALLLASCSFHPKEIRYPETGATLEGTVTYGKDLVGAALVIAQSPSGSATAFVDDDGRFQMQNVPLGEVNLAVDTTAGRGRAMGMLMSQTQGKARGAPKIVDVPAKYAKPATSGITTTISQGANTYDIVIPK
jgi:hypothetical protein